MHPRVYLDKHARKLDLYLYEYLFEGAGSAPVLKELSAYQNTDGGFGHALDADLRLPGSSALATTIALQYLSQIDVNTENPLIADATRYLLKYAPDTAAGLLQKLSERALQRLHEIDDPEPHEVKCYVRLYQNGGQGLQKLLYELLAKNIKQVVKIDPKDWQGYVPTPLTFVDSPDSPFADLFDESLLLENAKFLQGQMVDNSHWEPTWTWDQFEDDWAKAKLEWSGKLTVDNLQLLKAFGLVKQIELKP
ncbi:MAG: hypothetical protein ABWY71_01270 [Candidatus Saccharimonadales bacterium]